MMMIVRDVMFVLLFYINIGGGGWNPHLLGLYYSTATTNDNIRNRHMWGKQLAISANQSNSLIVVYFISSSTTHPLYCILMLRLQIKSFLVDRVYNKFPVANPMSLWDKYEKFLLSRNNFPDNHFEPHTPTTMTPFIAFKNSQFTVKKQLGGL